MKKNIIVLGDSFTYGQGCSDKDFYYDHALKCTVGDYEELFKGPSKYCWASLLQEYYTDYNVINLAQPGNDNAYMLSNAYKYIDDNAALVIFAGTMTARMHILDYNNESTRTWVMSSLDANLPSDGQANRKEIFVAKKYFLKYLYSEEMFSIYALNALYAAYGLACRYNAKFIWSGYPYDDPMHESYSDILGDMKITSPLFWYRNVEPELKSKDNHLNNLGHSYYYNEIVFPKVKTILQP